MAVGAPPVNVPLTVVVPPAVKPDTVGADSADGAVAAAADVVNEVLGLVEVLPPVPVIVTVCAPAAGVISVIE